MLENTLGKFLLLFSFRANNSISFGSNITLCAIIFGFYGCDAKTRPDDIEYFTFRFGKNLDIEQRLGIFRSGWILEHSLES